MWSCGNNLIKGRIQNYEVNQYNWTIKENSINNFELFYVVIYSAN